MDDKEIAEELEPSVSIGEAISDEIKLQSDSDEIYEGLDQYQISQLDIVLTMLSWVRTFYSDLYHLDVKGNSKALSTMGSLASPVLSCYRELRHVIHHDRRPDADTYAHIEKIRAHIRRKGGSGWVLLKHFEEDGKREWRDIDFATAHADIGRIYQTFKETFNTKKGV